MNDDDVMQLFQPLYNDLRPEAAFHVKKPLLAHYTTIPSSRKDSNNERGMVFQSTLYE